jgi:hypothetical protein
MNNLSAAHAAQSLPVANSRKARRAIPYKGLPFWLKLLNFASRNVDAS